MNIKLCYTIVVLLFCILNCVQGDSIKSKSINCNTSDTPNGCHQNKNKNVLPKIVSLIDIPGILNKTLGSSADKNIQITAVNIGSDKNSNHHAHLSKNTTNTSQDSDEASDNPIKNYQSHESNDDSNESHYAQYPHYNHYPVPNTHNQYHHSKKESQHSGEANIQITSVNIENADSEEDNYSHPGPIDGTKTCPANEEYRKCGTKCQPTCENHNRILCKPDCVAGCFCKSGYVRKTKNGPCIKISQCPTTPQCGKNEVYSQCASPCPKTCDNIDHHETIRCFWDICVKGCRCKSGFIRDRKGKCILPSKCPKHGNNGGCHHGSGENGGYGQGSHEHHGYGNNNYGSGNYGYNKDKNGHNHNYGVQGSYEHGHSNHGHGGNSNNGYNSHEHYVSSYGYGNNGNYGNVNPGYGHGHGNHNNYDHSNQGPHHNNNKHHY